MIKMIQKNDKEIEEKTNQPFIDFLWEVRRTGYFIDWEKIKNDI